VNQLDNRASNFYIALYWADFMAQADPAYKVRVVPLSVFTAYFALFCALYRTLLLVCSVACMRVSVVQQLQCTKCELYEQVRIIRTSCNQLTTDCLLSACALCFCAC
jgi:hypothetical protein